MKKLNFTLLFLLGLIFITGSFLVNLYFVFRYNEVIIKEASRAFFQEIMITREWNASMGGIYVPVTDHVTPNEYLDDPKRDITATDGLKLTKINPAFMTRQMAEIARIKDGVQYHITSLNPIRPANKPDPWERNALLSFETGNRECFEMVKQDSLKVFRYMAPVFVDRSCLNCHAKQGYKIGQIRGGISVTMKSEGYFTAVHNQILIIAILFLFLLIAGSAALLFFKNMMQKQFQVIIQQNEELQKNIHTKDTLFSLVSHDLKSPLSGALGLGEVIQTEGDSMSKEELINISRMILKSTRQTYQLSEQLVTWYSTQKGTGEFDPETLVLKTLVESCIELLQVRSKEKEISIQNLIPGDLAIEADKNMTEAILRNLIGNSLKFTPKGGHISISARLSEEHEVLEICVEDDGIGMPAKTVHALMTFDFQTPALGTENEKGTGIGLTLCKEFIKRHHGTFRIESDEGKGSKFIFTLPLTKKPR